jgi:NAD-dependent SIR2 family protein deacetylase
VLWGFFSGEIKMFYCEGCEQDLEEDEFNKHDELCDECYQAALERAEYYHYVRRE